MSITAWADCPPGWLCVWEHTNAQGWMARLQTSLSDLRNFGFNDRISSLWNRTADSWCAYSGIGYGGDRLPIEPGQKIDFGDKGWDNTISSLRRGIC
ncbi:hypothetical protein B1H26_31465 [Amycolatopsis sp. BJA-103]|nr:hypothetical protein B1H26_31465 [Amycolatopsis sp. BJA-103]